MGIVARYVHTNLIAEDWRLLAGFYQKVFGCVPVPPERDFRGEKLEAGTGVRGAHLRGAHLRLPGRGGRRRGRGPGGGLEGRWDGRGRDRELRIADGSTVTWCYVTDPEGNLIELQNSGP